MSVSFEQLTDLIKAAETFSDMKGSEKRDWVIQQMVNQAPSEQKETVKALATIALDAMFYVDESGGLQVKPHVKEVAAKCGCFGMKA